MSFHFEYKPGDIITHDEICKKIGCGCMGGIRYSKENDVVALFYLQRQDIYSDHWEDETFYFVGMGKGNQSEYYMSNRRITESPNTGTRLFLFERKDGVYCEYIGEMRLDGKPLHRETKDKSEEKVTQVLFPLKKI